MSNGHGFLTGQKQPTDKTPSIIKPRSKKYTKAQTGSVLALLMSSSLPARSLNLKFKLACDWSKRNLITAHHTHQTHQDTSRDHQHTTRRCPNVWPNSAHTVSEHGAKLVRKKHFQKCKEHQDAHVSSRVEFNQIDVTLMQAIKLNSPDFAAGQVSLVSRAPNVPSPSAHGRASLERPRDPWCRRTKSHHFRRQHCAARRNTLLL